MSHIETSHVTHRNESCHTYKRVMSHIETSHVTHRNESCHEAIPWKHLDPWKQYFQAPEFSSLYPPSPLPPSLHHQNVDVYLLQSYFMSDEWNIGYQMNDKRYLYSIKRSLRFAKESYIPYNEPYILFIWHPIYVFIWPYICIHLSNEYIYMYSFVNKWIHI